MKLSKGIVVLLAVCLALTLGPAGCGSHASKQSAKQSVAVSQSARSAPVKKTYSDIPTPYPSLYKYEPDLGLSNIYDESKVIDWSQAANYIGQTVTVEGDVDSVVHAASSNGSPYFFNIGGGAYEGFAVVIWSQDLAKFDQNTLRNDVAWSMSDQPLAIRLRVSGQVEMYNGRPQIVARDGTQVAEWINGAWCSMISDAAMDALMRSLYR